MTPTPTGCSMIRFAHVRRRWRSRWGHCTLADRGSADRFATRGGSNMPGQGVFTTRPVYQGTHGMLASGHYLGARAGQLMFDRGGNAIDAAVASGIALNVLEPQSCGIGGEVPILIYSAKDRQVYALSGQGWIGKAATIDWFRKAKIDPIPGDGFLPACVPAAFGSW